MPLDPQFRAILDTRGSSGLVPLVRGDAEQTRAHYRTLSLSRRGPGFVPEEVVDAAEANLEQILASLGRLMRSQAAPGAGPLSRH